jgi:hypothetical protein
MNHRVICGDGGRDQAIWGMVNGAALLNARQKAA